MSERERSARIPGLLVVPGDPHPFASSSCRGFDHHRVACQQQDIWQLFMLFTAALLARKCMQMKAIWSRLCFIESKTKKLISITGKGWSNYLAEAEIVCIETRRLNSWMVWSHKKPCDCGRWHKLKHWMATIWRCWEVATHRSLVRSSQRPQQSDAEEFTVHHHQSIIIVSFFFKHWIMTTQ